jgi:hypothetical protein
MSASTVYITLGLVVLLALLVLAVLLGRRPDATPLTPLGAFALGMVVAGFVFGENRAVGYTFFAVGIGLAVVDAVRRRGPRGPQQGG